MQIIQRNSSTFKLLEKQFSKDELQYLTTLDALSSPISFIYDTQHGAVFPFCSNNKLKLFKQVYTPWFVQEFKILGYARPIFLKHSAHYFKKNYGKVNLRISTKDASVFKQEGFSVTPRTTYCLQYVNLNLSNNHKRSLKKSQDQNFRVQTLATYEVVDFLRVNLFERIPNFDEDQIADFSHFITKLESSNQLKILGVRGGVNEVLAAAVFYKEGKVWHYLKGSANQEGRDLGAMHLIIVRFLEGLNADEILDFNGSEVPGVAKFYEGFGAIKQHYAEINYLKYPRLTNLLVKLKSYV